MQDHTVSHLFCQACPCREVLCWRGGKVNLCDLGSALSATGPGRRKLTGARFPVTIPCTHAAPACSW